MTHKTEKTISSTDETTKASEKEFDVERIYVKKSTFELVDTVKAFLAQGTPEIGFEIKTNTSPLPQEHLHEVVLDVTIKVKMVDKEKETSQEVCVCHIEQAGMFKLIGFSEEETKRLLYGYCADVLYPYIRQEISQMLNSASLPPVFLKPLSFESLYQQSLQKQKITEPTETVVH